MTFLSITPDALDARSAVTRSVARLQRPRASLFAQVAAVAIFTAALTVPGAVAQAKWTKLNLVLTFVQHRCAATFSG